MCAFKEELKTYFNQILWYVFAIRMFKIARNHPKRYHLCRKPAKRCFGNWGWNAIWQNAVWTCIILDRGFPYRSYSMKILKNSLLIKPCYDFAKMWNNNYIILDSCWASTIYDIAKKIAIYPQKVAITSWDPLCLIRNSPFHWNPIEILESLVGEVLVVVLWGHSLIVNDIHSTSSWSLTLKRRWHLTKKQKLHLSKKQ